MGVAVVVKNERAMLDNETPVLRGLTTTATLPFSPEVFFKSFYAVSSGRLQSP